MLAEIPEEIMSNDGRSSMNQNELEETYKYGVPQPVTIMDESAELLVQSPTRFRLGLSRSETASR